MKHPLYNALFTIDEQGHTSILREAESLVHGNRQADYGPPAEEWAKVGRMWGAILGTDPIPPRICVLMMAALKIAREVHRPKRDNRVDLAGYAECAQIIAESEDVG